MQNIIGAFYIKVNNFGLVSEKKDGYNVYRMMIGGFQNVL